MNGFQIVTLIHRALHKRKEDYIIGQQPLRDQIHSGNIQIGACLSGPWSRQKFGNDLHARAFK